MKHLLFTIAALLTLTAGTASAAKANISVTDSSSEITLVSDSVIDDPDTATYRHTFPNGSAKTFFKTWEKAADMTDGGIFSPWNWFIPVFGMLGGGMVMLLVFFLVLPVLLIVLIAWYIVRQRRRARDEDLRQGRGYTFRRDNAVRNICIGAGVTVVSLMLALPLVAVAGVVVLCVGVADYLVYHNHRDDNI